MTKSPYETDEWLAGVAKWAGAQVIALLLGKKDSDQGQNPTGQRNLWIIEKLNALYPKSVYGAKIPRKEARERLFYLLPTAYYPSLRTLLSRSWVIDFQRAMNENGYGFPGGKDGDTVVRLYMLSYEEFRALMIGKICLIKDDLDRVRQETQQWADYNDPSLDVEAAVQEFVRAARMA